MTPEVRVEKSRIRLYGRVKKWDRIEYQEGGGLMRQVNMMWLEDELCGVMWS